MADRTREAAAQPQHDEDAPRGDDATFKREGPEPAGRDSGSTVDEMNDAAADALIRNVTPDQTTD